MQIQAGVREAGMTSDVTKMIQRMESGEIDGQQLFSKVYEELKQIASAKLAQERKHHTLQATALVHEAWLRLLGKDGESFSWDSRGHFFASAAEAMRRILIDHARKKQAAKRGSGQETLELVVDHPAFQRPEKVLMLDEALSKLSEQDSRKGELVKLRFFAGLTTEQAAKALSISVATAERDWAFAKAWLQVEMESD